jgi:isopentenyldiphosphate isomerase
MHVAIVNQRNRPCGAVDRAEVLQNGHSFRTVHVFVFNANGELLLQKLPDNHRRSPGKLGSSVAGYIYANEPYIEAARRKTTAELGVYLDHQWLGYFKMADERSTKFVGLFSAQLQSIPIEFDHNQIAAIEKLHPREISAKIVRTPSLFTSTFLAAYEHFTQRGRR